MDEIKLDLDNLTRAWIMLGLFCGAAALMLFAVYYLRNKEASPLADFSPAAPPPVAETPSSNGTHDTIPAEVSETY
jgi:hypothetical protein